MSPETLEEYKKKRDFSKTSEPSDKEGASSGKNGDRPVFVIQKHDASTLHYDFRLEVDGVLRSWAVPKGPSTDPREKRLAIPTEDHPLAYADFEGTIPEGEYGGGTVMVWDKGSYRNLAEEEKGKSMQESLKDGHVLVWLEGEKISGGYALIRTGKKDQKDARWLLVKMDDDAADARRNPVSTQPDSVVSGMSMDEIAEEAASS